MLSEECFVCEKKLCEGCFELCEGCFVFGLKLCEGCFVFGKKLCKGCVWKEAGVKDALCVKRGVKGAL